MAAPIAVAAVTSATQPMRASPRRPTFHNSAPTATPAPRTSAFSRPGIRAAMKIWLPSRPNASSTPLSDGERDRPGRPELFEPRADGRAKERELRQRDALVREPGVLPQVAP